MSMPIKKTYHVYKADCFGTSRLYMQSKWDSQTVLIHRAQNDNRSSWGDEHPVASERLTAISLIRLMRKISERDTVVFHAQPALPYYLIARLATILLNKKKTVLVYDMHDLHEYEVHHGIINYIRYSIVRHYVLGIMEKVCFWDRRVKKMTVSEGLAREAANKYNCPLPQVVRNIPLVSSKDISEPSSIENKRELMYFGSPDRMPVSLMRHLVKQGLELHLYGKDITSQSIIDNEWFAANKDSIKLFGRYSPNELIFLEQYSFLILYRPEVNKLNYRYSLPNKLFQALNSGLSVLVSSNFSEMTDLFAGVPGAVEVVKDDEDLPAAIERASMKRDLNYRSRVQEFMSKLREESRHKYLEVTTDSLRHNRND